MNKGIYVLLNLIVSCSFSEILEKSYVKQVKAFLFGIDKIHITVKQNQELMDSN